MTALVALGIFCVWIGLAVAVIWLDRSDETHRVDRPRVKVRAALHGRRGCRLCDTTGRRTYSGRAW